MPKVDVNYQDELGNTALHYASRAGHVETVQALLAMDANPSIKNKDSQLPLNLAMFQKHDDIVVILLEANTDLKLQAEQASEMLYRALTMKNYKCAERLLKFSVSDIQPKPHDPTTLFIALDTIYGLTIPQQNVKRKDVDAIVDVCKKIAKHLLGTTSLLQAEIHQTGGKRESDQKTTALTQLLSLPADNECVQVLLDRESIDAAVQQALFMWAAKHGKTGIIQQLNSPTVQSTDAHRVDALTPSVPALVVGFNAAQQPQVLSTGQALATNSVTMTT